MICFTLVALSSVTVAASEPIANEQNNENIITNPSHNVPAVVQILQLENQQGVINESTAAEKNPEHSNTNDVSPQATQCEQLQRGGDRAGNVYLGANPPNNCHVLQGTANQGNLRIHIADGLINVQRYNGGWVNQYYTYGGGLIYVNGEKTSLGYYDNDNSEPSGGWGSISNYQEPVDQSKSDSTITTTWMVDGIQIKQYVTYEAGNQFYSLEWDITNTNEVPQSDVRFLRGADTYLANGDFGTGFWESQTDTVSSPAGRSEDDRLAPVRIQPEPCTTVAVPVRGRVQPRRPPGGRHSGRGRSGPVVRPRPGRCRRRAPRSACGARSPPRARCRRPRRVRRSSAGGHAGMPRRW